MFTRKALTQIIIRTVPLALSLAALTVVPAVPVLAQAQAKPAAKTSAPEPPSGNLAPDQPIVPGDRINVAVIGEEDLTRAYAVDPDGNIALPLIGKVAVKGMLPTQVREELTKRLGRLIRNPEVSVEYVERASLTVSFTGMVQRPGSSNVRKGSRLLDALAIAEGLTPEADQKAVRLQRRGEAKAREIDLSKLLSGDSSLNLELQDGDAVFVPRLPEYHIQVIGAVQKPGEVLRKERPTLLEAILAAGGINPDADRRKVTVLRKGAKDAETINLDEVLTGSKGNLVLGDGDVVTIPEVEKLTVKVFGAVAKPGEGVLKTGATVAEALQTAGGFNPDADKNSVFLTLPDGEVKKLALERLESQDGAMPVPSGARLFVPQTGLVKYAVSGGVNTPGVFPMPPADKGPIFLTDALAQAGGLVERAKKKNIVIVRKNPDGGQPIVHQIDFEKLLKKKDVALNMQIQPFDVVIVDVEPERDRKPKPLDYLLGAAGAIFGL